MIGRKAGIIMLCWLALTGFGVGIAAAVEGPNEQLGRTLFESTQLGSNGKSCATCHGEGKGLKELAGYSDTELKEMINFCIRDALKGRMFDLESTELTSMFLYLRTF